jgi:hypothetical protein
MKRILKSYFFWTYPRGHFHYDIMVTLILAFIFITPHLWDFGDKPSTTVGPTQTMLVTGDGSHGLIITVQASEVNATPDSSVRVVKKALRKAIEPVTGDAMFVEHWELTRDSNGNPKAWKVWAHR